MDTWITKCGLFAKKESLITSSGSCSFMGATYSAENNNHLMHCRQNVACELREKVFDGVFANSKGQCALSKTDKEYDYKKSVEKIVDDLDELYNKNRREFLEKNPLFRGCANYYRDENNQVKVTYDLKNCLVWHNGCLCGICAVTKKKRDLELVNIYCNIKSIADKDLLTEHELIRKGIKLTSVALVKECAERELKKYESWVAWDWKMRKSMSLPYRFYLKKKIGKDLLQDLEDIKSGIEVIHDSDLKKKTAEEKRERKVKRKQEKLVKVKKVAIEIKEESEQLDLFKK